MEITTNPEATMTKADLIAQAVALETEADNLYWSLLAPSMREKALRDDAAELRAVAAAA